MFHIGNQLMAFTREPAGPNSGKNHEKIQPLIDIRDWNNRRFIFIIT